MSTRAQASGAVGSVIDGRFRDLQEQRDLNYPVCVIPSHPILTVLPLNQTHSHVEIETNRSSPAT